MSPYYRAVDPNVLNRFEAVRPALRYLAFPLDPPGFGHWDIDRESLLGYADSWEQDGYEERVVLSHRAGILASLRAAWQALSHVPDNSLDVARNLLMRGECTKQCSRASVLHGQQALSNRSRD